MDGRAMTVSLRGQYAGFVSRLIAFGIDIFITSLIIFLIGWITRTTADMVQIGSILNLSYAITNAIREIFSFLISPPMLVAYTSIFILIYHIFFLVLVGSTPGKALLGLRVVSIEGKRLNFSRVFLRVLGYIPSIVVLFAGFLWIIIDNRRQGWHDKLARTCVIYAWDAHPDERFLAVPIKRMNLLPSADEEKIKK